MTHLRYIWGGIAGALLFFLVASRSSAPDIWRHGVQAELAAHKAWQARSQALQQAADRERATGRALSASLANDRLELNRLGALLSQDSLGALDSGAVHGFVRQCEVTLTRCDSLTASWRAVADSERTRADLSGERLARADSLLKVGLRATTCRMLGFLPCASRGQSLVLGLVVGAVVGRSLR